MKQFSDPLAPRLVRPVFGAGTLSGLCLVAASAVADVGPATTYATGLMNPRGMAFAPNGALYVAAGGKGGAGPCVPSPANPAVPRCYGETGALTRILADGTLQRILIGLPSLAQPSGLVEGGPTDVAFLGNASHLLLGWGGDPAIRAQLGVKAELLGTLLQVTPSGQHRVLADLAAHEAQTNPIGAIDSNPYGLTALPGRVVVADAGANAVVEVLASGQTRTLALPMVPPRARESVPTTVTEGPDGALYVGTLTSGPFFAGTAQVQRIQPDGSSLAVYAAGYTAIVDIAFDGDGALYVLEVARGLPFPPPTPPDPGFGQGRLKRQCAGSAAAEVVLDGLFFPAAVAIGPDGAVYVTNFAISPTAGEVLRLPLARCS